MRFLKMSSLLSLLLVSCLSMISAQTTPIAQEQIAYYFGEVKTSSLLGQPYGSSISLVKRTLKPAENKIIELVASIEAKQPAKEFTTVFDVKGSKFTMKDQDGGFTGEGELTGKAWEWTGWQYSVNLLGQRKGMLKGEDSLNSGGLMAKKSFSSPD